MKLVLYLNLYLLTHCFITSASFLFLLAFPVGRASEVRLVAIS
jgi:hypothetical protein